MLLQIAHDLSWESKGTLPMPPPPPGNKALFRDY